MTVLLSLAEVAQIKWLIRSIETIVSTASKGCELLEWEVAL